MRVVSWNLEGSPGGVNPGAWKYLLKDLDPDVALLQEIAIANFSSSNPTPVIPDAVMERYHVHAVQHIGTRKHGTAVIARKSEFSLKPVHIVPPDKKVAALFAAAEGSVAAAEISNGTDSFLAVSVHTLTADNLPADLVEEFPIGHMLKGTNRLWWADVVRVGLKHIPCSDQSAIVAGDWNLSRQFPNRQGNQQFFDLMRKAGWTELHRIFREFEQPTFARRRKGARYLTNKMLDHSFATTDLALRCLACDVDYLPVLTGRGVSDHTPLVMEFR